jgi:hypothetical protein
MAFDSAINHIIQNNPKARQNPRGLSQLDRYKRGLVNSLTGTVKKLPNSKRRARLMGRVLQTHTRPFGRV